MAVLQADLYSPNTRGSNKPDGPFEVKLHSCSFRVLGRNESDRVEMAPACMSIVMCLSIAFMMVLMGMPTVKAYPG